MTVACQKKQETTMDYVKVENGHFTRGGTTGIQQTIAPVKVINNGAIYNLAGQKVNENYKGIVIKNGKKYIQK